MEEIKSLRDLHALMGLPTPTVEQGFSKKVARMARAVQDGTRQGVARMSFAHNDGLTEQDQKWVNRMLRNAAEQRI